MISCKLLNVAKGGMDIIITNFCEDLALYFRDKNIWNIFYSEKSPITMQFINSKAKKFECKGFVEINPYNSPEEAKTPTFIYKFMD